MTAEFELRYPAIIRFGWGCRRELPAVLAQVCGRKQPAVVLVCSRSLADTTGLADLRTAIGGEACPLFSTVPPEPLLATVDALADLARSARVGALVAVGGGSVIDVAKAAAVTACGDAPTAAYYHGRRPVAGPLLPLVALPTTAGSGAEITCNAVLTDPAQDVKKSLRSPLMVPRAALVDPELTVSLPAEKTAWSGLDALTQAAESYLSTKANAASRALAREAVRLLLTHLAAAVGQGTDREARTRVAEGSLLSAMAFSQSGLGAVHGLAHPLGLGLGVPHGLTCAILLPPVLELNATAAAAEQADLARFCGLADAAAFRARVTVLCRELGVPAGFRRWRLAETHFPQILATCRSGSMQTNPRLLTDAEILDLLRSLA